MKQNLDDFDEEIRDEVDEQTTFAFFENLHIDLSVAIERRENLNATMNRETISAQDIDFFDVAIDNDSEKVSKENSEKVSKKSFEKVTSDSTTNFDDARNDEMIDSDEKIDEMRNEIANSTDC